MHHVEVWNRQLIVVLLLFVGVTATAIQPETATAAAPGGLAPLGIDTTALPMDRFGGVPVRVAPSASFFRVAKINNRWVFVTPDGNAFWMKGVYNVEVSDHVTDAGTTYRQVVKAKYGDADLTWGPQQNRRLQAWGFNALAEYASKWTLPWTTINDPRWLGGVQPVQLPAIPFPLQGALRTVRLMRSTMRTVPSKNSTGCWTATSRATGGSFRTCVIPTSISG